MVILMLSAIMVGVARFVGRKGDISQTRADLAGLALAIDSFKLDTGGYPATTTARVSCVFYGGLVAAHARPGPAEVNNSAALYSNLTANGRAYIRFRKDQIQKTNIFTIASVGLYYTNCNSVIVDRWGTPINYFRPSSPVVGVSSISTNDAASTGIQYYYGGQVNPTYDLFSYGPDRATYLPATGPWNSPSLAADDIINNR